MFLGGFMVWGALEYMMYGTWISGEQSKVLLLLAVKNTANS